MASLIPNNQLINVTTWGPVQNAWLQNQFVGINLLNKRFKNFQNMTANLGQSVSFDAQPRFRAFPSLVVTEQPSVQRVETLTCSQAQNVAMAYTDQQLIFNADQYMDKFGRAAAIALGTRVEIDILLNLISSMQVTDPQASNFGAVYTDSGPYRFYGNPLTSPINSFSELMNAAARFQDIGWDRTKMRALIPLTSVPPIITSSWSQFTTNRNNDTAQSWELGNYGGINFYSSNLLPVHTAGTIGDATGSANQLTVVSTNDPTGENVTQITCTDSTGSLTDINAIKLGDMGEFVDGVSGKPNVRALNFTGYNVTREPAQFLVTANAAAVSGTITLTIRTINGVGLVWAANQNQNINVPITAGMKIRIQPSCTAGLLDSGDQFYGAMPNLDNMQPYPTSIIQDKDSGFSFRHYYGAGLGNNQKLFINDILYGVHLVPDGCMRLPFAV